MTGSTTSPARPSRPPQNIQALTKLAEWGKAGYFNKDYNAVGYDQAAAEFAKGKGLFFVGGNWETAIIKKGLGTDAGMINMPPGESGKHVGVGATSGPWHISAKTKYPDVAAAWLNYIHSSPEAVDMMYKALQIPAIAGTTPPADDPFLGEVTASWQQLVSDGGLTLYADWASPSMYDTLAKYYQEAMAGKTSPEDAAKAIQADWSKFDASCRPVERRPRRARSDRPPREPCLPGRRAPAPPDGPGAGRAAQRRVALHPARASPSSSCSRSPAAARGMAVAVRVGRPHGRQVRRPRQLLAGAVRPRRAHRLRARAVLIIYYSLVPVVLGLALTGFMTRHTVRGFTFFRTVLFLPQMIAGVVIAQAFVWFYAEEGPFNAA